MNINPLNSVFAFGGPSSWNKKDKNSIQLIDKIIQDKQLIHSCYDYGGHLEFVREAAKRNNLPIRLIIKCYLNYPKINSIRRRSICYQIERVLKFFEGLDVKLIPQISSIKNFSANNLEIFIKKASRDYFIENLLIETFPEAEISSLKLMQELMRVKKCLNLNNELNLGFTAYENINQYGFTKDLKRFIYKNKLLYAPMRIIGNKKDENSIEMAKNKLVKEMEYEGFYAAITQVSNLYQYNDLINFSKINIGNNLRNNSKLFLFSDTERKRFPALNAYGLDYKPSIRKKISTVFLYLSSTMKSFIFVLVRRRSFYDLKFIFNTEWL